MLMAQGATSMAARDPQQAALHADACGRAGSEVAYVMKHPTWQHAQSSEPCERSERARGGAMDWHRAPSPASWRSRSAKREAERSERARGGAMGRDGTRRDGTGRVPGGT